MGVLLLLQSLWPFPLGAPGLRWRQRGLQAEGRAHREACLERAAAAGDLEGMVLLGDHYASHGQQERALPLFRVAAERGHGVAAFGLAELIRWEYPGGGPGLKASFRWYVKAAEAGFGPAQAWLAQAYAHGEGVAEDPARAEAWAARTPTLFWPPEPPRRRRRPIGLRAWWETLNLWVGQYATRPWYPFALAVGFVLASYLVFAWMGLPSCGLLFGLVVLGLFNLSVLRGPTRQRFSLGRLERQAGAGDAEARHRLGLAYRDGAPDVPRDRILACRHFRVAAEAGHVQAMVDLADLLWWGKGGDLPDPQEAQAWLDKARALGHPGLEEGALRTAVTPALPPEARPAVQRLEQARRHWDEELGPRSSRWLFAGASVILLGILIHLTYRNTSWIGRRDRLRVVWGDAMNRVAAPRDAHATVPIPAGLRPTVEPFPYQVVDMGGGTEARHSRAWLGQPVLLVVARGRYPAFRETLGELDALTRAYQGRATLLSGYLWQQEAHGAAVTVQAWLGNAKYHTLVLGLLREGMDQPALGDLSHTPVTLVLDRQSRVRQRWVGYQPGLMKEALEGALAEGQ